MEGVGPVLVIAVCAQLEEDWKTLQSQGPSGCLLPSLISSFTGSFLCPLSLAVLSRPLPLTPQCPSVLRTFDLCSKIPWRQYEDVEGVWGRTEWGNQENSGRGS